MFFIRKKVFKIRSSGRVDPKKERKEVEAAKAAEVSFFQESIMMIQIKKEKLQTVESPIKF